MHDLIIIGGGPAGVAAGVYAARKRLKTIFIAEEIGGQSAQSTEIQNWIGTEKISGMELAKSLENHLRAYAADLVDIRLGERVQTISAIEGGFEVRVGLPPLPSKGEGRGEGGVYTSRAILIATGGARRKLNIPGAEQFEHKGLTYCASCDGPLFAGQDVVVVGSGNAGFDSASQLLAYCKSVTILNRSAEPSKADPATVAAVLANPNARLLNNTVPVEIRGTMFVENLLIKNTATSEETALPVSGVFVEIGADPATGFAKDLIELAPDGTVQIDYRTQRTTREGIWAAGDCTNIPYHQNNIAAGDAVKALEDIYYWLQKGGK